ncbi:2-octaprenyl-6-methoxyphenol hydroxylase [Fontimonas thermophila]|uniref:2-octaprenyl-6-methoxyphenol hydroxylase n=1 Tax=Fontimonas thermophila TaxID=1076937 RepID=A0A1I2I5V2_9GAMM|nr:2-octaprenyl-6-methoxyphenyl hydroxylase [Fontimonas thermophila]SFF37672.1 2-octaprenyl-6-methoxyphenol hydroxylase [Fontimonas thermophila]
MTAASGSGTDGSSAGSTEKTAETARIDEPVDVAIVGGGLIGASVALGLARSPLSVALIEPAPPRPTPPSWDERCIAINHVSHRILDALGVWPELSRAAAPILSTHISEQGRFGVARFSADEAGLEALGYNVPIHRIGELLWQRVLAHGHARIFAPMRVAALTMHAHHVALALDGGGTLAARLVVAADGADSPLRRLLGVDTEHRDYAQSAIVTAVRCTRPHRGCAYERFTCGGPLALLPKPWAAEEHLCSLIWTTPAAEVASRMAWSDAEFLAQAQAAFGERLGRFVELGRRQAYPLARVVSRRVHAPRVVFVGNAAQSLHPVAAQGFNLGLRDAATLIELLAGHRGDPGDGELLQRYADLRSADRRRVADFTDGLVRVFSNRLPGLRGLRHLGLLALDLLPPLREAVLWQNLGYAGYTPAVARTPR